MIATKPQIMEHFSLQGLPDYQPDYNIPPGQKILSEVRLEDDSNKAVNLHWGFIPSWSKDRKISNRLINARVETLTEKPSFRNAYQHRRSLIPATGFLSGRQQKPGNTATIFINRIMPCSILHGFGSNGSTSGRLFIPALL